MTHSVLFWGFARVFMCVCLCTCFQLDFRDRQGQNIHVWQHIRLTNYLKSLGHTHFHTHSKQKKWLVLLNPDFADRWSDTFEASGKWEFTVCTTVHHVYTCEVYMDLVFEPLTSAVLVPCSWTEPAQIKLIQPPKSLVTTDQTEYLKSEQTKSQSKVQILTEPSLCCVTHSSLLKHIRGG